MSDSSTSFHLVCPACQAVNRLPRARSADAAKCGRCRRPLFTGEPVALDAAAFRRHLVTDEIPLLVDFWAAWCGPCRTMAPVFAAAAAKLEPALRFAKLDTEAAPEVARHYNIASIPTLVLFMGGKERARVSGAMPPARLEAWIADQLAASAGR